MDQESIKLIRHSLASIDLSDVEHKEESETERKEYCAAISAIFPRLEKTLKRFLYAQLMYASNEAETWERVIFARGTFNGLDIILEHLKQAHNEHMERGVQNNFDKNSPLSEL